MSDLKFDQFEIKFFLIVSCLIVVAALVVAELFSSPSDEMQGGGGGQLGSIFTGYVPLTSENPYHCTLFFGQLKTPSCLHL